MPWSPDSTPLVGNTRMRGGQVIELESAPREERRFLDAPRETRTPTPHKQDKALNLVDALS
jgi:hypothetical protein